MTQETMSPELAAIRALSAEDDRSIAQACAVANSITVTIDQFERGMQARDKTCSVFTLPRGREACEAGRATLVRFCEEEGILPADAAAEVILLRNRPIQEANDHRGGDIKKKDPALYRDCITRSIHQGYFRYLKPAEIGKDGSVIPLPVPA